MEAESWRELSLTDGWGVCSPVTDYSKQPVGDQTDRREGPRGASNPGWTGAKLRGCRGGDGDRERRWDRKGEREVKRKTERGRERERHGVGGRRVSSERKFRTRVTPVGVRRTEQVVNNTLVWIIAQSWLEEERKRGRERWGLEGYEGLLHNNDKMIPVDEGQRNIFSSSEKLLTQSKFLLLLFNTFSVEFCSKTLQQCGWTILSFSPRLKINWVF